VTRIDDAGYVTSRSTASTGTAAIACIGVDLDRRASSGRTQRLAPRSPFQRTTKASTCGSHKLRLDGDVAVRRPGIRTHLVRRLDQALRYIGRDAGQADVRRTATS